MISYDFNQRPSKTGKKYGRLGDIDRARMHEYARTGMRVRARTHAHARPCGNARAPARMVWAEKCQKANESESETESPTDRRVDAVAHSIADATIKREIAGGLKKGFPLKIHYFNGSIELNKTFGKEIFLPLRPP